MITTLKEFRESFEAPKNFKINMIPKSQMNRVINPYGNRTGEDDRPGVEVFGRMPQNIPALPGFKRILYEENNPKQILTFDVGPLDIVYKKDISEYKIYSEHRKSIQQGTTMYYGWNADIDFLDNHFFIILNTVDSSNKNITEKNSFTTDPVTLTKEEMIDTVNKIINEFNRFSLKSIEYINPTAINDGILDDSVDYFH